MQGHDEAQVYGRALMVANCDLKNGHKYGRFQLTMEECSKSQIVTLNAGRGQFYGENRFCIQPLRNNEILVRKKAGFHGQVSQNEQLIRKKAGFYGQTRTVVLRTNVA